MSYGELMLADEERLEAEWWHTASLAAVIVNSRPFRPKHDQPVDPSELHPLVKRRRRERPIEKAPISALKVFLPRDQQGT